MIKRQNSIPAFILLEVLISLFLASFIIMGMMQGYRTALACLDRARTLSARNRKVALLIRQIEHDFTAAYIPTLARLEATPEKELEKEGDQKNQEPKEVQKKPVLEEKEPPLEKRFLFFSEITSDTPWIHQKQKFELLKRISCITTNPFQTYGEKKKRIVRIGYELEKDKERSTPEKTVYLLIRKECFDLANKTLKEGDPSDPAEKSKPVTRFVVATMIHGISFQFKKPQKSSREEKPPAEEEQLIFTWGGEQQQETHGLVPEKIVLTVSFWHENMREQSTVRALIIPMAANPPKETPPAPSPVKEQPEKIPTNADITTPLVEEKI